MVKYEKFHGRIKNRRDPCEWPECEELGEFKAPKKFTLNGELHWFCLDHIREYNANYNYFENMTEEEVSRFQMAAFYWHRPTWPLGEKHKPTSIHVVDPFGVGKEFEIDLEIKNPGPLNRPLRKKDLDALSTMGLSRSSSPKEIKSQYKRLVKKYHPDKNNGDLKSANRLREVIEAYNYLRENFRP